MAKNNYYKATTALGLALLGLLLVYPWHTTFWGGLLTSGFRAAMIGGLADWFAVTALFRRPLGIPGGRVIRTEIIPRNRDRIFNDLACMVQEELLTPEILKDKLNHYDISQLLVRYLDEHGGQENIGQALDKFTQELVNRLDPETSGNFLDKLLAKSVAEQNFVPLVLLALEYSLDKGYEQRLMDYLIDELLTLAKHPQVGTLIFQVVRQALEVYEQGRDRRKFVNNFIIDLSPVPIAELVQAKAVSTLTDIRLSPSHPVRLQLQEKLLEWLGQLSSSHQLQEDLNHWIIKLIKQQIKLGTLVNTYLKQSQVRDEEGRAHANLADSLKSRLDSLLATFRQDKQWQNTIDRLLKDVVRNWIDSKQPAVGELVRQSLNKLSNDMLVALIEEKAGNDLQIIRINGTVVGGLAGILIYLATFWLT